MSQAQVMEVLEQNKGEWFTSTELIGIIGITSGAISCNLSRLRLAGQIKFIYDSGNNKYLYKHKRYKE